MPQKLLIALPLRHCVDVAPVPVFLNAAIDDAVSEDHAGDADTERARALDPVPPGPGRMGYQYWAAFNFHANFSKAFYYRDTSQRLVMPRYETDSETDFALDFLRARSGAQSDR